MKKTAIKPHLSLNDIHCCLDCNYTGPLMVMGGTSQCPQCASRAVWPVAAWVSPQALLSIVHPFHHQAQQVAQTAGGCCDIVPSFFGGPSHE